MLWFIQKFDIKETTVSNTNVPLITYAPDVPVSAETSNRVTTILGHTKPFLLFEKTSSTIFP